MRSREEILKGVEDYYAYFCKVEDFGYERLDKVTSEIKDYVIRFYEWLKDNELSDIDVENFVEAFVKVCEGNFDMEVIQNCYELELTGEEQTVIDSMGLQANPLSTAIFKCRKRGVMLYLKHYYGYHGEKTLVEGYKALVMGGITKMIKKIELAMFEARIQGLILYLKSYSKMDDSIQVLADYVKDHDYDKFIQSLKDCDSIHKELDPEYCYRLKYGCTKRGAMLLEECLGRMPEFDRLFAEN